MNSYTILLLIIWCLNVFGIIYLSYYAYKAIYIILAILNIFFYPIIVELLYNNLCSLIQDIQSDLLKLENAHKDTQIVYSDDYNFRACGLENLHRFDATKYHKIASSLVYKTTEPFYLSRHMLLELGMSRYYLLSLCYSIKISFCVELPLFFLPGWFLRAKLLNPMLLAASGTVMATEIALRKNWAINLGGGFHHASCLNGGGFCIYPDITFAVKYLQKFKDFSHKKIMIVDMDAHQGNGYERDLLYDENVIIVDVYNHGLSYPNDELARSKIQYPISITYYDKDDAYLQKIQQIEEKVRSENIEFLIYNAGSDILQDDPLGALDISPQGMIKRDRFMFDICKKYNIPIVMLLSGGYQKSNARHITRSIEEILQTR